MKKRIAPVLALVTLLTIGGYTANKSGLLHKLTGESQSTATKNTQTAIVDKIIDGDTISVKFNNQVHKVRLLNIDTPETHKDGVPTQCLGNEAKNALQKLLPLGSTVTLEFDKEKKDQYNRLLAAVHSNKQMVNEYLVKNGLAVPVQFGNNSHFFNQLEKISVQAKNEKRGLFDPNIECTLAHAKQQMQNYTNQTVLPKLKSLSKQYHSHSAQFYEKSKNLLNESSQKLNQLWTEALKYNVISDRQFWPDSKNALNEAINNLKSFITNQNR